MDGSWKADLGHGVAAWEQVSEDGQEPRSGTSGGCLQCFFSVNGRDQSRDFSVAMGCRSKVFYGLCCLCSGPSQSEEADSSLQTALLEFCLLCSHVNVVKVVKVARNAVNAAQVKSRAALLDL